jgi:hypothetical protein
MRRMACWAALILVAASLFGGCAKPSGEGFALYLTQDNRSPGQMTDALPDDLADQPLIAGDDIVAYDAQTHEIQLTETAYDRIMQLQVPTSGTTFVVCVDRAPIYWGAFWEWFSSQSFDGVVIMGPLDTEAARTITLELGYPGSSFFTGKDPRGNKAIMKALEQAGKLVNQP